MLTKETATAQAKRAFRVAEKMGRWPAEDVPTERAIEAVVENLFTKPSLEGVLLYLTPQEQECVRIALDAYQAEMEENAEAAGSAGDTAFEATFSNEAAVALSAREKFRISS